MRNRRFEHTGVSKPGITDGLMGTGQGLPLQDTASRLFRLFGNRTDPLLLFKSGPVANTHCRLNFSIG
jgi:hypothetical protein